jgi:hypothetical protein
LNEKEKIIEIFFGFQEGILPEEYLSLQKKYYKDKNSIACGSCGNSALIRQYKQKILKGELE